jgi:glucose/arabinose dehydrogenase
MTIKIDITFRARFMLLIPTGEGDPQPLPEVGLHFSAMNLVKYMHGCEGMREGRRTCSLLCTAAVALLCAVTANAQIAQQIASGLTQPVFVTAPAGDTTHIFIVQQTGQILRFNLTTGTFDPAPFFNIQSMLTSTSGEQGLLGLAFDPNYATNGKFYLNFTVPGGQFGNGVTHVSQFSVAAPSPTPTPMPTPRQKKHRKKRHPTPTPAPAGERILLQFDHPQTNHNGGWIDFSPRANDAYNLYIATGDGGSGNDQGTGHIEPGGNAQNTTTLLGKILRIHVDPNTGTASIPSNNPFATSSTARREIFALGLRNPYRASFDRQTGDLAIGDVGQSAREEIDIQPAANASGGENFGWRLREGTIQTPGSVGGAPPPGNVEPILDYGRSTGGTVIGGYFYRGSAIPALQGKYVFADYLSARIFTLDYNGTTASNFTDITAQLFPQGGLTNPSSLGEDAAGELYITDIGSGKLFKIVP